MRDQRVRLRLGVARRAILVPASFYDTIALAQAYCNCKEAGTERSRLTLGKNRCDAVFGGELGFPPAAIGSALPQGRETPRFICFS